MNLNTPFKAEYGSTEFGQIKDAIGEERLAWVLTKEDTEIALECIKRINAFDQLIDFITKVKVRSMDGLEVEAHFLLQSINGQP